MKVSLKDLGKLLIVIGLAGFLAAVIISFTVYSGLDQGALPAASFFAVMLGFVFVFPSMLEEAPNQISTMRIIVFAVVMVFCILYIKIGWSASFEDFKIDPTWTYILGLAFGSKVFQKFAENNEDDSSDNSGGTKKDKNANNN